MRRSSREPKAPRRSAGRRSSRRRSGRARRDGIGFRRLLRREVSHTCLVMTGAGDPAFVKNFNPYTATGLPSGGFVQGAFYEPLIVTGEGGLKPVPWLARTWKLDRTATRR